mmetsp:Transcript_20461/g.29960  ORF Transcript_20461/g.29960 Transcript_20461/m.29960 type:complete len:318 (-) Transcript_20461:38-991(-)
MEIASNVDAALNLLRRTPVQNTEENLNALSVLLGQDAEAIEDLFQRVDCPLKYTVDNSDIGKGRKYIQSDHNRDGDSYRSPWSNAYYPPLLGVDNDNAFKPSRQLRKLEQHINEVFDSYRQSYYGNASESVSSVYLWNKEDGSIDAGFAGCFLIKKDIDDRAANNDGSRLQCGYWNSIHVVDVNNLSGNKAKYELHTTVLLSIDIDTTSADAKSNATNKITIGGSLTKQVEKILPCANEASHIANIGKMIEDAEIDMRSKMDGLYIQKTREVMDAIRCEKVTTSKYGLMAAMMGGRTGAVAVNEMSDELMARLNTRK